MKVSGKSYLAPEPKTKPAKEKGQNITVVVRLRPRNELERSLNSPSVVEAHPDRREVAIVGDHSVTGHWSAPRSFTFDRVFDARAKQIELYRTVVSPLLEEVIQGYSCTVFAYGQTGTGKTYTMEGMRNNNTLNNPANFINSDLNLNINDKIALNVDKMNKLMKMSENSPSAKNVAKELKYSISSWEQDPQSGIIPRSIHQLFELLERSPTITEFSVRVSFLEIYNEELYDLLGPPFENQKLRIFEDGVRKGSVVVQGLEEVIVHNKNEVYNILEKGANRRQTAATLLNANSSRSHTVFSVMVNMKEGTIHNAQAEDIIKTGRLYLVDLAGSENIGRSGAVDKLAREAGTINQSLLTLGRVISALVHRAKHVPYRESKLTRLLQDSLGGRTKTVIIATISPSACNIEETISTLEYAQSAKHIKNIPEVNKLNKKNLIREYTETIDKLHKDLAAARDKNGIYVSHESYNSTQNLIASQKESMIELEDRIQMLVEQLEKMNTLFETNQNTLDSYAHDLKNAKKWLKFVRKEIESQKNILKNKTILIKQKEFITAELLNKQNKLFSEYDNLAKMASTQIEDMEILSKKLNLYHEKGKENQNVVTDFKNYIDFISGSFKKLFDDFHAKSEEVDKNNGDFYSNASKMDSSAFLHEFEKFTNELTQNIIKIDVVFKEIHEKEEILLKNYTENFDSLNKMASEKFDNLSVNIGELRNSAGNFYNNLSNDHKTFKETYFETNKIVLNSVNIHKDKIQSDLDKLITLSKNFDIESVISDIKIQSTQFSSIFKDLKNEITESVEKMLNSLNNVENKITVQNNIIDEDLEKIKGKKVDFTINSEEILSAINHGFSEMIDGVISGFGKLDDQASKFMVNVGNSYNCYFKYFQENHTKILENLKDLEKRRNEVGQFYHQSLGEILSEVNKELAQLNHCIKSVNTQSKAIKDLVVKNCTEKDKNVKTALNVLFSNFENVKQMANQFSVDSLNFLISVAKKYQDSVLKQSYVIESVGDTPQTRNVRIKSSTPPRTLDELTNAARCAESDTFYTPSPKKKRAMLNKLDEITEEDNIPSFIGDCDTSKSLNDKENLVD